MTLLIEEHCQLGGFYRLQTMRGEEVQQDTGWFKNLITNQGMDWIGTVPAPIVGKLIIDHCGVGTGTATPAFSDTRLASPLAMYPPKTPANSIGPSVISYVAGTTPYWSAIWSFTFPLGTVVGNISEVGVGKVASTDTDPLLFSRCLILDSLGNPTVISVTALDVLVVTYELRYYIATGDNTYSMVIDGTFGPVTYTGTYRRMNIGTVPVFYYTLFYSLSNGQVGDVLSAAYQGFTLGPITGGPSYTAFSGPGFGFNYTNTAYINGTYYAEFTTFMPLNLANFTPGISGITVDSHHGQYQFSVTPVIPKTSSYVLNITWRVYWSRYP